MRERGSRNGRRLSSEDLALWRNVTRSVRPTRKPAVPPEMPAETESSTPVKRGPIKPEPAPSPAAAKPQSPRSVATIDRRTKQKIARGSQPIDARLDLHGHSQAQAHDALLRFLRKTQSRGGRLVLVITGKGGRGDGQGTLKRAVPLWLAQPEFRAMVIGFDTAATGHGGEGALYVRVRKRRE